MAFVPNVDLTNRVAFHSDELEHRMEWMEERMLGWVETRGLNRGVNKTAT